MTYSFLTLTNNELKMVDVTLGFITEIPPRAENISCHHSSMLRRTYVSNMHKRLYSILDLKYIGGIKKEKYIWRMIAFRKPNYIKTFSITLNIAIIVISHSI